MSRSIPGSIDVPGREFLYVEVFEHEGFREFVDAVKDSTGDVPLPEWGGTLEGLAYVTLEDGSKLLSISYKGDVAGWRRRYTTYCDRTGRKWGIASQQKLQLSNGVEIDLCRANVTLE